jgi:hypothetical protein
MARFLNSAASALLVLTLFTACDKAKIKAPADSPAADAGKPAATSAADEIRAAMAKLSPEDRKIAEEQQICPVTDAPLGSMDAPFKVTFEDKPVFLCCEGCAPDFQSDPEMYLAKLKKQPAAE